ncbi:MAG TPA: nucleotidyl transferase AbiEii/AbiGii toxin family protein [Solirubrobacteraceae bacterium]|nr:nucleotidyl transferase AbiEii/AbiGii toxin family protein [Solirubrobacteraceae bacterium]
MSAPTRAGTAGRAYLDLRKLARDNHRPVDELMQLYVLEAFLVRLTDSRFAEQLVLKGGVLLAAFDERRPTRDIDLQAHALENDTQTILAATCEIAAITLDDGVIFDVEAATAEPIRDEAIYSGVRVTMTAQLATARPHFHVDTNVGDPISPAPKNVRLPRLLGGEIVLRGYPLAMVHAEKIVTAIGRGTVNTRWRDFADIYVLARHHAIDGSELARAIRRVTEHRKVRLRPLAHALDGYGRIGQQRWTAWRRRQRLEDRLPEQFGDVVAAVIEFADPAILGSAEGHSWEPITRKWS